MDDFFRKVHNVAETVGITFVVFAAMICLLLLLANVFQFIEYRFFPVVSDFKITYSHQDELFTYYNISFIKERDCIPILEKFAWYAENHNGYANRLNFQFPPTTQEGGNPNRPLGKQSSNGWRVDYNVKGIQPNSSQTILINHSCFPHLWDTVTRIKFNGDKVLTINNKKQ